MDFKNIKEAVELYDKVHEFISNTYGLDCPFYVENRYWFLRDSELLAYNNKECFETDNESCYYEDCKIVKRDNDFVIVYTHEYNGDYIILDANKELK